MQTTYHNPVIPGFAPDPSMILVGDTFFLVNSSFHMFPGLPIYASKDLKTWKHIGNAISRPGQLTLRLASTLHMPLDTGHHMLASGGLFAATIRHHEGIFYVVCTNAAMTDEDGGEGGGTGGAENFFVTTKDIYGEWSDPVYVPFAGIDPDLFFDDDGRAYLQGCFQMDRAVQPSCDIRQFEVDLTTGRALSETRVIWTGWARYDTEGPHIYKVGAWYYLVAAEGGTFEHHMLSVARSRCVSGPYEAWDGNPVVTADGTGEYIQNVGHGDLVRDGGGNWWAVVLGVRDEETCQPLGRETFLSPVDWPEGGWPVIRQPKMEFTAPPVGPVGPVGDAAAWDPPRVPPRVSDLYVGEPEAWRYRLPPTAQGPFSLVPSMVRLADPRGPTTFVGRRQRSLDAAAETAIDLAASRTALMGGAIRAGLVVYKDHFRHAMASLDFSTRRVTLRTVDRSRGIDRVSDAAEFAVPPDVGVLALRVVATAARYVFSARPGGLEGDGQWTALGACATEELAAREMTGPVLGVFANTTAPQGEKGEVVFTDLVVKGPPGWE